MDPSSEQIAPIARKHGIILFLRFGSSVTGRLHERSDVDLAVLLERVPRSLAAHAELLEDLQQLFPDREVDLALLNRADPLFLKKITEACRLLYGSCRDLQRLKIYAFKRYQDHRKYLEMERSYVERSLQALASK
jgi:predicted nucleotidyltransferase